MILETKITRGKTRPGRLALLDRYVATYESALIRGPTRSKARCSPRPLFVDIGFGEFPYTTLESARRFGAIGVDTDDAPEVRRLEVIGVDADPERVRRAQELHGGTGIEFRRAGFPLRASLARPAQLIRAMNVLREYDPRLTIEAHCDWGSALVEGGLLVEGSTDKAGHVMGAVLLRNTLGVMCWDALFLATDFARGFAPLMFRDWLPQGFRGKGKQRDAILGMLGSWQDMWTTSRALGHRAPKLAFADSATRLAQHDVAVRWGWVCGGAYLVWSLPWGRLRCVEAMVGG